VVPAPAIISQPEGGGDAVMIAGPDNKAHLQAVHVGIKNGDEVQITEGLKAGQSVITTGAYGLPDNTNIKVEAAAEPEKKESEKPEAEKVKKN